MILSTWLPAISVQAEESAIQTNNPDIKNSVNLFQVKINWTGNGIVNAVSGNPNILSKDVNSILYEYEADTEAKWQISSSDEYSLEKIEIKNEDGDIISPSVTGNTYCVTVNQNLNMSLTFSKDTQAEEKEISESLTAEKIVDSIENSEILIPLTEKPTLEELKKQFPSEMTVTLSDGTQEIIPVEWICECDYENDESDSYAFEVALPEGYRMSDTCASAFILVTLEGYDAPDTYRVYDPNETSTVTIDKFLGATQTVESYLSNYENSNYYLGTKYYGEFLRTGAESCLVPQGASNYNGTTNGLNCTGFVANVMRSIGGDINKITTRMQGHYANAVNWNDFVDTYNIKSYRFTSISSMLSSGVLKKGDLIYFEPDWSRADDDCHIGFFWGDSSNESRFWHSTSTYNNAITTIQSKSPIYYIYVFPVAHEGKIEIQKKSANPDITNNNPNYSLEGAVYGVYLNDGDYSSPEYTITTDKNGYGKLDKVPVGKYWIKEITAPKGFALDPNWYPSYSTTYEVKDGETLKVNFTDYPQADPVGVLLGKIDAETNKNKPQGSASLKDAEFEVKYYAVNPNEVTGDPATLGYTPSRTWILKTDEDGYCDLTDSYKVSGDELYLDATGVATLPVGVITIQEQKAPEGYLINEEVYVRTITSEGTASNVHTYNMPQILEEVIKSNVKITKYGVNPDDAANIKTPLAGIDFVFTSKTDGTTYTITTDKDGMASTDSIGGIPYDTYIVTEKNTPKEYDSAEPFEVTIDEDGKTLTYEVINKEIMAAIKIIKKDAETGNIIKVAGTEFRVLDSSKKIVEENILTDENGEATLSQRLPYGTYYLEEVNAPSGYLKGDLKKFTVSATNGWDSPIELEYFNERAKGKIKLLKESSDDEEPLEGAEFEIRADEDIVTPDGTVWYSKGHIVDTLITDKEGKAESDLLEFGKYSIVEVKAPEGFILSKDTAKVELKYANQNTEVNIEQISLKNKPTCIKILKIDSDSKKPLPGVTFKVWNKSLGISDEIVEAATEYTTDENGKIVLKRFVPGTYCIKESNTIAGYIPDDSIRTITISSDGRIKGEEEAVVTVENKLKPYALQVNKKNSQGTILDGVEFTLYEDKELTNILDVKKTSNGTLRFDNLTVGKKYYLKETKALDGYAPVLDENGDEMVYEIYTEAEPAKGVFNFYVNGTKYTVNDIAGSVYLQGTAEEGRVVNIEVINKVGSKLPKAGSGMMIPLMLVGTSAMLIGLLDEKKYLRKDEK